MATAYPHLSTVFDTNRDEVAPMLGQAVRLIAYNRANRKQARRA